MNKKLTLNIDDSIIKFAHFYAKESKQSISNIVESYFTTLKAEKEGSDFSTKTNNLYGLFEDNPLPDKKEMRREFHEKNIT